MSDEIVGVEAEAKYKEIIRAVPGTTRDNWQWPIGDTKLVQVFDQVADIDVIMQHVPEDRRGVCIQAGGACGIWPLRFSHFFETVLTFEPQEANFACLLENTRGADGIVASHACLAYNDYTYTVQLDRSERGNAGAWYMEPKGGGEVSGVRIDDLNLDACDLIQLDVEGFELVVVMGGVDTIAKYKPVIVLEEKALPQCPGGDPARARKWLEKLGYSLVAKVHRDVILTC